MAGRIDKLYGRSLALLTDLYQLTMAAGYWQCGMADREAVFLLTFRECPFDGEFAISCGLSDVVDFLEHFRFSEDDLACLATIAGADQRPLFSADFLTYLRELKFTCDIDALPEGTPAFAHEPLVRVRGPLLQCQLLETPLLTLVNFPTLVATKAARVCHAAAGEPVLEFGLRRAQGIDGGVTATRAAFVGGCAATSNVLAGKLFGIPVKGTHAHSWVMSFDDEIDSFRAYARAMPNNCVFLVDTYDTLQGVRNAVEVGRQLREEGHEMVGIRLDSGDLSKLSITARKILDEGGFPRASIVASNDLDEYRIAAMKEHGARINVWGVGTRLVTAFEQPALGGVYKLAGAAGADGRLQPRIKVSQTPIKTSTPGVQQVRRFRAGGRFVGDVIYAEKFGIDETPPGITAFDGAVYPLPRGARWEDLLVPVYRQGRCVYEVPSTQAAQKRARQQLAQLPPDVLRLREPAAYPVGLERRLASLKAEFVEAASRQL